MGIEIDLVALRSSLHFLTRIRFPLDPSPCQQQHCSASLSTVSTGKLQPSLPSTSPKPTLIQSIQVRQQPPAPGYPCHAVFTSCTYPSTSNQDGLYTNKGNTSALTGHLFPRNRKDTASFCLAMSVCLSLCASLSAHSLWVHAGKEAF